MADEVMVNGDKYRITIHIDGVTYTLLNQYAKHLGVATPNHAAFAIVVRGLRALRAEYEFMEAAYHAAMMVDMEHRKTVLKSDH
jgi:hypothetical protein